MRDSYQLALELNLAFAKANLAAKMNATMPIIRQDGVVRLNKARHPLIDKQKVVPVDLQLGEDFTTLVITGPNTGGKTVTLKTIGLFTLMTMAGLLIPAGEKSEISVFSKVFVDIGSEQSIEQNLSTFSAHMTHIISILQQADPFSLVLLDELGSGTDPVEGAALAISILETLRKKGCTVAATTHYAELKMYALETHRVENACCEFDIQSLQPTYKLLIGVPGRSNAFAISERLGLDPAVISYAGELIASDSKHFEQVIGKLESSRQELEQEKAALSAQIREMEQDRATIRKIKNDLQNEQNKTLEQAQNRAKKMISDLQFQAFQLMDELETLKKEKDQADFSQKVTQSKAKLKNRLQKLDDIANPIHQGEAGDYVLPRKLQVGDSIRLIDVGSKGVVLSEVDKKGRCQVQIGAMKVWTEEKNLMLLNQKKETVVNGRTSTIQSREKRTIKTELDLRGHTVEEALLELDLFIDNAVMTNVNLISIIHGKGTGALRSAVQQHLKKHKNIRTFRLGVYGEGESGVTIAELK